MMASERLKQAPFHLPTLDGLRALSIVMVLAGHAYGTRGCPRVSPWFGPVSFYAVTGVTVFFVVSGFLITTLLLRELGRSGTIRLREFYLRRTLRIFPAYYLMLAVVSALWLGGVFSLSLGELLSALTYTRNFYPGGSWYTGHAWSLALEEQFYLLWPAALLAVGRRRAVSLALTVTLCAPLCRVALWFLAPHQRDMIWVSTFSRMDAILVGCLLALVRDEPWFRALSQRFFRAGGAALSVLAVVASLWLRRVTAWHVVGSFTFEAVAIALVIEWTTTHPESAVGRALEHPAARYVGGLSYSLYLWQQLFLNRSSAALACSFPLNLACAFAAALASRHLCEEPFLRLKDRISKRVPARSE